MKQILETSRLILREMEPIDLDFIAEMLGNAEVMRYWPKCYSREEAKEWLLRQLERYLKDGYGYWLVLEKETNRPVGQVGLLSMKIDGREEIGLGYIIHHPFWKKGFATEAASACIQYAFQKLNKSRVIALIRPENESSQKVAQKLLMLPIGFTEYAGFNHLIFAIEKH
jgi:ribosomal-protein-alanine N-acetyltransferase